MQGSGDDASNLIEMLDQRTAPVKYERISTMSGIFLIDGLKTLALVFAVILLGHVFIATCYILYSKRRKNLKVAAAPKMPK